MGLEQHQPEAGKNGGRDCGAGGSEAGGLILREGQGLGANSTGHRGTVCVLQQVEHDLGRLGAEGVELAEGADGATGIALQDMFEEVQGPGPVGQAQHVADQGSGHGLPGVGLDDGLVQQGLGVPHRALGGPGDQGQALGLNPHPLGLEDHLQVADDVVGLHPAQVEPLAAGEDGHRHLADLGGGEDELGVGRRLLEGLQERIEGSRREHVHLVDDVDLVARLHRGVAHPVQQVAHVCDAGPAGGVQLQDVHVPALDDGAAVPPLDGQVQAGGVNGVRLEVQRPGEEPGRGGLAHPPHAGEHEGVGDASGREGVAQGPDHGLLAIEVLEGPRAVLPGDDGIGRRAFGRGCPGRRWCWHCSRRRVAEHVGGIGITLRRIRFGREIFVGHGRHAGWVETGQRPGT